MNEIIELVARAICAARGKNPERVDTVAVPTAVKTGDRLGDVKTVMEVRPGRPRWHVYEGEARAAIEAMRDPPAAMLVLASLDKRGIPHSDQWQAMIDAALKA